MSGLARRLGALERVGDPNLETRSDPSTWTPPPAAIILRAANALAAAKATAHGGEEAEPVELPGEDIPDAAGGQSNLSARLERIAAAYGESIPAVQATFDHFVAEGLRLAAEQERAHRDTAPDAGSSGGAIDR